MKKIVDKYSIENKFSFNSSFFRLFICFHLLKDVILSWKFKQHLYMSQSFYVQDEPQFYSFLNLQSSIIKENFQVFYFIYILLILFYFFGVGKNLTAFLVYIFYELLQNLCPTIQNGRDNLLKFIMLYMVFINSFEYFTLEQRQYFKNIEFDKFQNFLSNVFGFCICLHLCLIYFISAIHKIHSDVWFNGVATYYTLSLERFRGTRWNLQLVKNGIFVTLSTYGTILIELLYPFLIWFSKTKNIMIILAIILHLSIYIFMMIYDFQIVFIFVQGFFISNVNWIQFYNKLKQIKNE